MGTVNVSDLKIHVTLSRNCSNIIRRDEDVDVLCFKQDYQIHQVCYANKEIYWVELSCMSCQHSHIQHLGREEVKDAILKVLGIFGLTEEPENGDPIFFKKQEKKPNKSRYAERKEKIDVEIGQPEIKEPIQVVKLSDCITEDELEKIYTVPPEIQSKIEPAAIHIPPYARASHGPIAEDIVETSQGEILEKLVSVKILSGEDNSEKFPGFNCLEDPIPTGKEAGNKYHRLIFDVEGNQLFKADGTPGVIDVYSVLEAFDVKNPGLQHGCKKLLCSGIRGKGSAENDILECYPALDRAVHIARRENK